MALRRMRSGPAVAVALVAAVLCGCRGGSKRGDGGSNGSQGFLAKCMAPFQPKAPCAPEDRPVVTRVVSGDVLRGHLYPDQGCQCFYFDGVESSLLDFEFATDVGNEAAPNLEITTPDGKALPLRPALGPEGSACQRASGIVLPKTGTYKAMVCKAPCEPAHYWRFEHTVRLAPPVDTPMHLTACTPLPVTFTCPTGSHVQVRVRPQSKCGVLPTVVAVEDPDGGRALDAQAAAQAGLRPAEMARATDGTMTLNFAAPKSGRYTVLVGAEKGTEGPATTSVNVNPPKAPKRSLYHGGWPCPEGEPGKPALRAPAAPRVAATPMPGRTLAQH